MESKIAESYIEVNEVLKLLNKDERDKIPSKILMAINEISGNNTYNLNYNANGRLVLSEDAEAILLYLYDKYILIDNEQLKTAIYLRTKINQETIDTIRNINSKKIKLNDLFPKNKETTINTTQKEETLKSLLNQNQEKRDKELREKYNPDNIFKNKISSNNIKEINEQAAEKEKSMTIYKESIITKIWNFIKGILKK